MWRVFLPLNRLGDQEPVVRSNARRVRLLYADRGHPANEERAGCARRCAICFGNDQQTQTQTKSVPPWLQSAATGNLNYVQQLRDQGFQGYAGNQVAGFSPQQQQSFYAAGGLAGAIAPYTGDIGSLARGAANAPAAHVYSPTIASRMSPYMNQYVMQALQPQLQAQDVQFAQQNKGVDSAATMAGAFGDTGWGQLRGTTTMAQDAARSGLIGNAYNAAFNTAIGAGAQDVSNNINAQTTNANLYETALQRQAQGANQLYGLGSGVSGLLNTYGGQQTAQSQAGLNAAYNQWLMAQQYPFQTAGLMNQTIGAAQAGAPITTTTSSPNNSGYGLLGAGLGALGSYAGSDAGGAALTSLFALSDPKLKENAEQVGELYDGTPVHKFNFKGDPRTIIGLMAPDVKKKTPAAVDESGPFQKVDYSLATRRSAKMGKDGGGMTLEQQLGAAAA